MQNQNNMLNYDIGNTEKKSWTNKIRRFWGVEKLENQLGVKLEREREFYSTNKNK